MKSKLLTIIIGLMALLVAGAAESFSVYGIYKTFGLAVCFAAAVLGCAKVVTTVFLHKNWKTLPRFKWFLGFVIIILMFFTSMGIVGFISHQYQSTAIQLDRMTLTKQIHESEYKRLESERTRLLSEKSLIEATMNEEIDGIVVKEESRYYDTKVRGQVRARYQPQISEKDSLISSLNLKMSAANDSVSSIKMAMINVGKDVGPIMNIADIFSTTVNNVVQAFIYILVPIFDPFALFLVIAWSWSNERMKKGDEKMEKSPETGDKKNIEENLIVTPEKESLLLDDSEKESVSEPELGEEKMSEEVTEQNESDDVKDTEALQRIVDEAMQLDPKSQKIITQKLNRQYYL